MLEQKGAIQFIVLLILLAGIVGGVWLITKGNPLKLFSRASTPPIVFKTSTGQPLPTNLSGVPQTTSPTIKIELTSTFGPPATSYPTPSYPTPSYQSPYFTPSYGTPSYGTPSYETPYAYPTPITPSPTPTVGFGKSIKITSVDSYISTSYPGPLVNIRTIALWIKPDSQSLSGTNSYVILGKEFASGEISGFSLSVANKKLEFKVAEKKLDGTVAYKIITSDTQLQANKWYYISIFNLNGLLSMYINGVQQGATVGLRLIQDNKDRKLVIGCAKPVNFSCLSPFYGEIDEVLINILTGVAATPPTVPFTPTSNTLTLYHLDGDAKDVSSRHYDGQVVGSLQFVSSSAGACTSTLDKFQGVSLCSGQFETPKYYSGQFTCTSGYSSTVRASGYPLCDYESDLKSLAKTICETASPEHCSTSANVQGVGTAGGSYYTPSGGGVSAPITKGTVSYKIAENPADLTNKPLIPYTAHPTILDYTFQASTLGQKFIWVEFRASDGSIDRKSAQIDLVSPSISGPITPTPIPSSSPSPTPTLAPTPTPTPSTIPSPSPSPTPTSTSITTPQPTPNFYYKDYSIF